MSATPDENLAAARGADDIEGVICALRAGANPAHCVNGIPLLLSACQVGSVALVQAIKDAGGDLNIGTDKEHFTGLMYVTMIASRPEHPIIRDLLLDSRVNINARDVYGYTAFDHAVNAKNWSDAQVLLDRGGTGSAAFKIAFQNWQREHGKSGPSMG